MNIDPKACKHDPQQKDKLCTGVTELREGVKQQFKQSHSTTFQYLSLVTWCWVLTSSDKTWNGNGNQSPL